jgi:polysaccharide biosynthesis PFTS motif protein
MAFWYSANNLNVKLHGSDHAYDESRNILAHINTHFVWNISNKKYLIKLNPEKNIIVVGSIIFYTAEKLIQAKRNVYTITIFDVNAYSNFKTPMIYTDEVMSDFIKDLFYVFEHKISSKDFMLRIKHKRNKLQTSTGYRYGVNYEKILAEFETKSFLHFLDVNSNLYNTVAESDLVVGIPFTSPCFIAKETKVPSIFYVPSSGLVWDFPDEIDGIPVIKNISNLKKYLSR